MKQILLLCFIFLVYASACAQSAGNIAAKNPQQIANEKKVEKTLEKTPQGINNMRLGLPASASIEEYKKAKEKLYTENPQKYKELFASSSNTSKVKVITRDEYNKLSDLQKKRIDEHPTLFNIID